MGKAVHEPVVSAVSNIGSVCSVDSPVELGEYVTNTSGAYNVEEEGWIFFD